jgi:hypothetical protein
MKFLECVISNNIIEDNTKYNPHPYIKQYYDEEFSKIQNKKIKLLEIGVRYGVSMMMWDRWFKKGEIHGIDITPFFHPNIKFTKIDAYSKLALDMYPDDIFDYIIDDGPHTPQTQKFSIQNWINKIKPGGKMIIEDIGCKDDNGNILSPDESLDFLIQSIDCNISDYKVFDLRETGQYDSIILEITKK